MATGSWADGAVDETIGSAQDRATIAAFESAHDGETPTNGTTCKGSQTGVDPGTGIQYFAGWQSGQNATTYVILTSQSGDEPDGISDATGSKALIQGSWFFSNSNAWYCNVIDLEILVDGSFGMLIGADSGGELNIINTVFRDGAGDGVVANAVNNAYTINVGGCVFKDVGTGNYNASILNEDADVTFNVINTSIIGSGGLGGHAGISSRVSGANITVKNCALVNNAPDFGTSAGGTITQTFCGYQDSVSGTGNFAVTSSDADDFTEPSTGDLTVYDTNSALYHTGTNITDTWFTTLCPTDLLGTSWNSTPSVGAYEFDGGAPAGRPLPQRVFSGCFSGPFGGPF